MRNVEPFLVCIQGRSCTAYVAGLKALERMSQGSGVVIHVQHHTCCTYLKYCKMGCVHLVQKVAVEPPSRCR